MFKIKKKFVYRHLILKTLYDKIKETPLNHQMDLNKTEMEFKQLALQLKIDELKLLEYHEGLHGFPKDEQHVICKHLNGICRIYLDEPGIRAYLDEYWLRAGRLEVNERIYDRTKWLVPIIALLVTIGTIIFSNSTIRQLKNKQQQLQGQINGLERRIELLSHNGEPTGVHP
jgi:hypothetical protein